MAQFTPPQQQDYTPLLLNLLQRRQDDTREQQRYETETRRKQQDAAISLGLDQIGAGVPAKDVLPFLQQHYGLDAAGTQYLTGIGKVYTQKQKLTEELGAGTKQLGALEELRSSATDPNVRRQAEAQYAPVLQSLQGLGQGQEPDVQERIRNLITSTMQGGQLAALQGRESVFAAEATAETKARRTERFAIGTEGRTEYRRREKEAVDRGAGSLVANSFLAGDPETVDSLIKEYEAEGFGAASADMAHRAKFAARDLARKQAIAQRTPVGEAARLQSIEDETELLRRRWGKEPDPIEVRDLVKGTGRIDLLAEREGNPRIAHFNSVELANAFERDRWTQIEALDHIDKMRDALEGVRNDPEAQRLVGAFRGNSFFDLTLSGSVQPATVANFRAVSSRLTLAITKAAASSRASDMDLRMVLAQIPALTELNKPSAVTKINGLESAVRISAASMLDPKAAADIKRMKDQRTPFDGRVKALQARINGEIEASGNISQETLAELGKLAGEFQRSGHSEKFKVGGAIEGVAPGLADDIFDKGP